MNVMKIAAVVVFLGGIAAHFYFEKRGENATAPSWDGASAAEEKAPPKRAPDSGPENALTLDVPELMNLPKFKTCREDADCVSLANACRYWEPVNVKHQNAFRKFVHSVALRVRCGKMGPATTKPGKAHCVGNTCVSDEKN